MHRLVGRLGGPLGELAHLLGELLDVRRAHISIEQTETAAELAVGTRVSEHLRVDLPGIGIDVDVRGRSATSGRFDYHHRADDPDPDPYHDRDHDHR